MNGCSRCNRTSSYQNQIINPLTLQQEKRKDDVVVEEDLTKIIQQSQHPKASKEDARKMIPEKPIDVVGVYFCANDCFESDSRWITSVLHVECAWFDSIVNMRFTDKNTHRSE